MKILILTQYYPPEVGAPQNRLSDLAKRLSEMGVGVEVLTAMPNYPQMKTHPGYKGKIYRKEEIDGITVHRSWIFVSKSRKILPRLLNYFSFVFSSLLTGMFKTGRFDYILVESPPLFLGISGYLLKLCKRRHMIFNVSDLWPESAEKLGIVTSGLFLRLSYGLEAFLYKRSCLITGQTMGIVENIRSRFPEKELLWFPNGIDPEWFNPEMSSEGWREKCGIKEEAIVMLYAGIVGHAQGLDTLLEAAELLRNIPDIRFVILGSGPEKDRLMQEAVERKIDNVLFLDAVQKKEMPVILREVDIAYIPLKKLDIFQGAIPSKIFESLAMEKPIILGVDGEARKLFVDEGNCAVFVEPENPEALAGEVMALKNNPSLREELGKNGRKFVHEKFDRRNIAGKFLGTLSSLKGK